MDWTGGVRRRFAPGKSNATLQKQKAHFAKARAALQGKNSLNQIFASTSTGKAGGPDATQQSVHLGSKRQKHCKPSHPVKGRHVIQIVEDDGQNSKSRQMYDSQSTSFQRQPPHRRSLSVISISSRPSSSSLVSSNYQKPSYDQISRNPRNAVVSKVSEEEELLLANRRRLLARTDWLGLAARQPVDMKFASSHDKDRIGKRRKVEKPTSHKGRPAGQRLLTPLFVARADSASLDLRERMLSDKIRVKIGTDALASQTQRSRQSRTPGKTSMRHPSTEFGPLSEESMLLGSEGELFEVSGSQIAMPNILMTNIPEAVPFSNEENDKVAREMIQASTYADPTTTAPPVPNMVPYPQPDFSHYVGMHDTQCGAGPDSEIASLCSDQGCERTVIPETVYNDEHCHPTKFQHHAPEVSPSVENDNSWRQMFHIDSSRASHSSMKALKSSSMHITTSESGHRSRLEFDAATVDNDQPLVSTPKGAGTQGSMLHMGQQVATDHGSHIRSSNLESPSASLERIEKLATIPAATTKNLDDDDDALWRHFIIGSQDSSDEPASFNPDGQSLETNKSTIRKSVGSPVFTISGLGTSANSTLGDTLYVHDATPKQVEPSWKQRKTEGPPAERHDRDSIEDVTSTSIQQRIGNNIHAAKRGVLNPKMFKKPINDTMNAESKARRRATSSKKKLRNRKRGHSVYDLIDID